MSWIKFILSMTFVLTSQTLFAKSDDQNAPCLRGTYDPNPDEGSCVLIERESQTAFKLTAMNRAGHVLNEARLSAFVTHNQDDIVLRYDVLPLDSGQPVEKWELFDYQSNNVIYSTLNQNDSQFRTQRRYFNMLKEEYNYVILEKRPEECREFKVFCPVATAVAAFTIAPLPIAAYGCYDLQVKCERKKEFHRVRD